MVLGDEVFVGDRVWNMVLWGKESTYGGIHVLMKNEEILKIILFLIFPFSPLSMNQRKAMGGHGQEYCPYQESTQCWYSS